MKFTIPKSELLKAIQIVYNLVGSKTTLPILNNILIKADKQSLLLMTTNLDFTISYTVEAKVEKTGTTTIPAKRLFAIIRELPESDIEVSVDDKHRATITCGSSFFVLLGQTDDEFPVPPGLEKSTPYRIDQKLLKEMLGRTSYAASTDESRPILNGVLASFKGSKLSVVATDGRRLALAEHEIEVLKEAEKDIVLPIRAVDELLRALQEEGEAQIILQGKQVIFEFSNIVFRSKLLDGSYPNYRQVIPASCDNRVAIEREAFLAALRRVSLMSGDGMEDGTPTNLTFSKNRLIISAAKLEVGEARETLPVKYTGKDLSAAFNARFLMDPLKVLASDEVYLEITDDTSPAVLKADLPFLYVIMPIRIT